MTGALWLLAAGISLAAPLQKKLQPVLTLHHAGEVSSVAFSPDGKLLATAYGDDDSPGGLALWDAGSGKLLWQIAKRKTFAQVAFFGDGSRILSLSAFDTLQIWDVKTHRLLTTVPNPKRWTIHCFAVSPSEDTVALGVGDFETNQPSQIVLWDVKTGAFKTVANLPATDGVIALSFSPDGKMIAGAGGDWDASVSEVKICDVRRRRTIADIENCPEGVVNDIAFSPKGNMLAVVGEFVGLRDVRGRLQSRLPVHGDQSLIAFSPDGENLAVYDARENEYGRIKIWRVKTHQLIETIDTNTASIDDLVISPHGRLLAAASEDGNVRLWRLTPPSGKHD